MSFASPGVPVRGFLDAQELGFNPALLGSGERASRPTTVVGKDQRKYGYSWQYPLRCVGRVNVPGAYGSGCLVGPRHVLTAAHVGGKNPVGNATFTITVPNFLFVGGANVSVVANVIAMFPVSFYALEHGSVYDCGRSQDLQVLVLDWRMGDVFGVFLVQDIQNHPIDTDKYKMSEAGVVLNNGQYNLQYNENSCKITDEENCWFAGYAITHNCDIVGGHSGGPVFIWTTASATVVGVQSGEYGWPWYDNTAGGGPDMTNVIEKAVAAYP